MENFGGGSKPGSLTGLHRGRKALFYRDSMKIVLTGLASLALGPTLVAQSAEPPPAAVYHPRPDDPVWTEPEAVVRARVSELPLQFSLDDSMAMAPGLSLSKFPKVVVTARVSRSGQPTAQPGDLQGASAPVANDEKNVSVIIDTVVK